MEGKRVVVRGLSLALFAALTVWIYARLGQTYTVVLQLPLRFQLPPGRALAAAVPRHLTVHVQGTGWQLLGLQLWGHPPEVLLVVLEGSPSVGIGRQQLLRSLALPGTVVPLHLVPDTLMLQLEPARVRMLPVVAAVRPVIPEGFVLTRLQCEPESVAVQGAAGVIDSISSVSTVDTLLAIHQLHADVVLPVQVSSAVPVRLSPAQVRVRVDIQPEAEAVLEDVPIELVPNVGEDTHELLPRSVRVWVRGPLPRVAALWQHDVRVFVPYTELLRDTTGIVVPHVRVPPGVEVFRIEPATVFHWRRL